MNEQFPNPGCLAPFPLSLEGRFLTRGHTPRTWTGCKNLRAPEALFRESAIDVEWLRTKRHVSADIWAVGHRPVCVERRDVRWSCSSHRSLSYRAERCVYVREPTSGSRRCSLPGDRMSRERSSITHEASSRFCHVHT